jgi:hypothetical protein
MKRSRLLAWLLLPGSWLPLAGCTLPGHPVAGSVASDLVAAQAVAKAGGDRQGAQCWGKLLPAVQALQASPAAGGSQAPAYAGAASAQAGVATALEVYRVAVIQAEGPCAPVVLPVVARLGPLVTAAGVLASAGATGVP